MADIIDTVDRICIRNDLERDRSIRNYKRSSFHLKHLELEGVWVTLTPPEAVLGDSGWIGESERFWLVTHPTPPDAEVPFRTLIVAEDEVKKIATELITEQVDLQFIKEMF
jgi:hypothetical protein